MTDGKHLHILWQVFSYALKQIANMMLFCDIQYDNGRETEQQMSENPVSEEDILELKKSEPDSPLEKLKCYKEIADVQTQFRKRSKSEYLAQ